MLAMNDTKEWSLKNPEVTINIELGASSVKYYYIQTYGNGWISYWTQGSVLSLMSGGFDFNGCILSNYEKRNKTHFIFFNLGGVAHEIGVKQVTYYLYGINLEVLIESFITIPFDDVVTEIF